jgi:hypothetical protein
MAHHRTLRSPTSRPRTVPPDGRELPVELALRVDAQRGGDEPGVEPPEEAVDPPLGGGVGAQQPVQMEVGDAGEDVGRRARERRRLVQATEGH